MFFTLSTLAVSAQADFTTFLSNGPSSNRVDIVFLGDGYTAQELDLYQTHINSMMAHFFDEGEDPFPRYKSYFNAHRVDVISQQSGADDPSVSAFVNTALDATYRFDGVTQRLLYVNDGKASAALSAGLDGALTADMKLVTVNATQYGGAGGTYAVYAGGNGSAAEVALHELGHSFAGLADEYGGFTTIYAGPEPSQPNVTKDPTGAKWARWNGYNQPRIGTIGAYDGGRYYDHGIYRPSLNSKMRVLGEPFDAVSREEFILDIYRIVDPVDSWLSNAEPLSDPVKLWVDTIDPAIIQHQWLVNGTLVAGAIGEEFDPIDFGFGPGTYTITSRNFDPTDWVRSYPELLQHDITWTVTYTVPEPSSIVLAVVASCWLVVSRLRTRLTPKGSFRQIPE
ncbi:MAG TPA: M64 family metallopeptidase [Terrimicrobiaceae bacterium]